jgi:hypothetical protein
MSSTRENLVWPIVFLIFTALGAAMLNGGYVHYEGQFFLVNYLDARSFFPTIFSAHFNEWDCYQGRELSFLFGWLDAEVIRYSARLGWIHLYSATHFAALFGLAVVLWRALPRLFPTLERRHAGLIVVLLLSSPMAVFSGYYYRPAKILTAFFLSVVVALLARMRDKILPLAPGELVALGAAATLMGMSDRLGVYFLLLLVLMLLTARPWNRASATALATLAVALAVNGLWSAFVGPRFSAMADGFPPNTADQIVHLRFTFLASAHYGPALSLLADHIIYFFGNFGALSVAGFVCFAALLLWRARNGRLALTFIAIVLATAAVYVAMYARLTSLPWPASRRVYYWLPQLVVLASGAALLVHLSLERFPRSGTVVTAVLSLMIGGNLLSLPRHRQAIRSQEHQPWIVQAPAVRECIRMRERAIAEFSLDEPYAQLCGSLRAAVAGTVWDGLPAAQPKPLRCKLRD